MMYFPGTQLAVSTVVLQQEQESTAVGRAFLTQQSTEIQREEALRQVRYMIHNSDRQNEFNVMYSLSLCMLYCLFRISCF